MAPTVSVGSSQNTVVTANPLGVEGDTSKSPVAPVKRERDDGTIFVSVVSFRDGDRCGATLKSIFDNAKEPEKVVVGVVEQNDPNDKQCLVAYCGLHQVQIGRKSARQDLSKNRNNCPFYEQIRLVAVFNIAAKGPSYARSLARKALGNEEYCVQVDAHTVFTKSWDEKAKKEWASVRNEFAVLSTVPAAISEKEDYEAGGSKEMSVPRQCAVSLVEGSDIPVYKSPADGIAEDLQEPLLSRAWSAAFSFAKCHLEEAVPYDSFAQQVFDAEQYPRYARMWTRGYDVYTPTQNIVFHDYSIPQGYEPRGWKKNEQMREVAIKRIKTLLQLKGGNAEEAAQANLGLYGLGKRRSLRQFMEFVGIEVLKTGSVVSKTDCANVPYVHYDASVSPIENAFPMADDLDPQPEYPLRQNLLYPLVGSTPAEKLFSAEAVSGAFAKVATGGSGSSYATSTSYLTMLFVLWAFGMFVWYMVFIVLAKEGRGIGDGRRKTLKKRAPPAKSTKLPFVGGEKQI